MLPSLCGVLVAWSAPSMDRGKTPPAINVVKWQAPAGLREVVMACGLKELRISE